MNVNELHDTWIEAGARVNDLLNKKIGLQKKYENDPDSVTAEDMKNAAEEYDKAVAARDFAKQNYDDARENMEPTKPVPADSNSSNKTKNIVSGFKDMLRHPMKYMENMTSSSSDTSSAGLAIPNDQQTKINTLMRQYDDLRDLVTIENVGTDHGTRNIEKFSDIKPMDQLDDTPDDSSSSSNYSWQDKDIKEGDYPVLRQIKYQIHDYGEVFFAPNDLLQDSDANIEGWLNQHIARKNVVTYNSKIVDLLPNSQKKATITKLDDIFDALGQLNMALWSNATLFINKSGFLNLAKVRMADGSRAMTTDPRTNLTYFNLDGMQYVNVRVTEDMYLSDNKTAGGKYQSHPFYFGNFKEYIHLFDRQQPTLLTSNIADKAFRRNQTVIRSLLRFDTKVFDDESMVSASFDKIASQPMIFQSAAVPNPADPSQQEQQTQPTDKKSDN